MFTNKKWFIMAIIGANIVIVGLIFAITILVMPLTSVYSEYIEYDLFFDYMYETITGIDWEILFILDYNRHLTMIRRIKLSFIYFGTSMLIIGGFLGLLGLIRYIQLEKPFKKEELRKIS